MESGAGLAEAPRPSRTIGRVELPLKIAFRISLQNIRLRLGRAMITASGTMLGIAFFVTVLIAWAVAQNMPQTGVDPDRLQAQHNRQIWLIIMALLICFVGIVNSMFMSVTERYREIGTFKCLGALDAFIVRLFLIESALLGLLGCAVGLLAGFLLMMLAYLVMGRAGDFFGMDWVFFLRFGVLGSLLIALLISIGATIVPAYVASRLPPAAALRTDI